MKTTFLKIPLILGILIFLSNLVYCQNISVQIIKTRIKPQRSTEVLITIQNPDPGACYSITGIGTEGIVHFEDQVFSIPNNYPPNSDPFQISFPIVAFSKLNPGEWPYVIEVRKMDSNILAIFEESDIDSSKVKTPYDWWKEDDFLDDKTDVTKFIFGKKPKLEDIDDEHKRFQKLVDDEYEEILKILKCIKLEELEEISKEWEKETLEALKTEFAAIECPTREDVRKYRKMISDLPDYKNYIAYYIRAIQKYNNVTPKVYYDPSDKTWHEGSQLDNKRIIISKNETHENKSTVHNGNLQVKAKVNRTDASRRNAIRAAIFHELIHFKIGNNSVSTHHKKHFWDKWDHFWIIQAAFEDCENGNDPPCKCANGLKGEAEYKAYIKCLLTAIHQRKKNFRANFSTGSWRVSR